MQRIGKPVWESVVPKLGLYGKDLVAAIQNSGASVSEWKRDMITAMPRIQSSETEIVIRIYEAQNLRFWDWAESDVFGPKGFLHLRRHGLSRCLSFDDSDLRMAFKDQWPSEVWVVERPRAFRKYRFVSSVECDDGGVRRLAAIQPHFYEVMHPETLLAVRVPKTRSRIQVPALSI